MKKEKNTKVYAPNFLSYALNDDLKHLKVWKQKIQQNKDVQQKRQIDRILQGVIKQRMFGDILSKEVKDSPSCYYTIDQISKSQINYSENSSKSIRSRANSIMDLQKSRQEKYRKLQNKQYLCQRFKSHQSKQDTSALICYTPRRQKQIKFPALSFFSPQTQSNQVYGLNSKNLIQRSQSIRSNEKLKTFETSKNKLFPQFFRQMTDNYITPLIFDVKITREKFIQKHKTKIPENVIEKMFKFFGFPQALAYKQYCNFVQKFVNIQLKLVHFFTFTLLDQSGNGFLTVSDLFKLMQNFPQNKQIEDEVFYIRNDILKIIQNLQKKERNQRMFKPTIEQTIISNHNLDLEGVKNLLKQEPTNSLVKSSIPKVSIYQNSIMVLEHDVNIRLKQDQIQAQQENNINKKKLNETKLSKMTKMTKTTSPDKNLLYQEGMKFTQFSKLYRGKRPKLFCLIIEILTGQDPRQYQ